MAKKMKIIYRKCGVALTLGLLLLSSSCKDSFLEPKPKGTDLEANYYRNQQEAFNGLVAIYDMLGSQDGLISKAGAMNSASDDFRAGGGGAGDIVAYQAVSDYRLLNATTGPQTNLWAKNFSGIFRANILLSKLANIPMDETLKKRYTAEAKFLRAFFYFDQVRLFKNVPLFTAPVSANNIYNVEQASPEAVYAQIEKDLTEAIADDAQLPNMVSTITEGGRVTKGTAHALLGKVYLYENKFAEAAKEFLEVNGAVPGQTSAKYGYKLLANFGNLWKSTAGFKYNTESILEIGHTSNSGGDWGCLSCTEGNTSNTVIGPRGYIITDKGKAGGAPDYFSGYGFNIITQDLFDAIHGDPRYKYTVANLDSLEKAGAVTYEHSYQNTGYFLEKMVGRVSNQSSAGGNVALNFPQNEYEIRLADTYLMEAEALEKSAPGSPRAKQLLDAVRARVGLGSIPVTLDNIYNERRLELAGEGHRWFDLVRTGKAAAVLGGRGFVAGTHEILPIPLQELSNTKLKQNPGYN
jgi:hypothetical protein